MVACGGPAVCLLVTSASTERLDMSTYSMYSNDFTFSSAYVPIQSVSSLGVLPWMSAIVSSHGGGNQQLLPSYWPAHPWKFNTYSSRICDLKSDPPLTSLHHTASPARSVSVYPTSTYCAYTNCILSDCTFLCQSLFLLSSQSCLRPASSAVKISILDRGADWYFTFLFLFFL